MLVSVGDDQKCACEGALVIVNRSCEMLTRCACGAPDAVLLSTLDKFWYELESWARQWAVSCSRSNAESNAVGELVDTDERERRGRSQAR